MKSNVTYNINTHGHSELTSSQIISQNCEDAEIRYLRDILSEGDHVLDIGGNIGLHTVNFGEEIAPADFPSGRPTAGKMAAFEPMSKNYNLLTQNIKKHNLEQNVLAVNAAVSDSSKKKGKKK